jgi:NarL family two-component system response regulator LiaR
VKLALELVPDVILMDIGLPQMNGIEASREIKAKLPNCRIIILTSHDLQADVVAALAAKCDGYCLKDIDGAQLSRAISSVHNGAIWLDPSIANKIIKVYVDQPSSRPADQSGDCHQANSQSRDNKDAYAPYYGKVGRLGSHSGGGESAA